MNNIYKYIIAIALFSFASETLYAQSYMVQKKDGTHRNYTTKEIWGITLYGFNSNIKTATVTLTAGDVWGDNSGYQMLLDANATAYGTIIPESGSLTANGDADAAIYNQFEYKIPENADGILSTPNIVINNSVTITIPAGTYDWCITNPTPGDRMWIAGGSGNVAARQDNYVFEAGKAYEFTVSRYSSSDGVNVSVKNILETGICINNFDGTRIKVPADSLEHVSFFETDYPEKNQIWSYVVAGKRYTLSKEPNKEEGQPNADGWTFYKSKLTLDISKDGTTTSYIVDDDLYLSEGNDEGQIPCVAFDLNKGMIYLFSNSKRKSRDYFEDGFFYHSSLDNINFQKETVFSEKNWGWYSYFAYYNGELSIQHFSFKGYYSMSSTRNSDGNWTTQQGIYIKPDAYREDLWRQFGPMLIIDSGPVDTHEYVDLGLPSGTLWATCNVGANSPEDYGNYFAWGETEPKTTYNWSTYKYCKGSEKTLTKYCAYKSYGYNSFTDNIDELEAIDDAATVNWGSNWQMPNLDQHCELVDEDYTTSTMVYQNDVWGLKITSNRNGNSIFLPAGGYYMDEELSGAGIMGAYWSKEQDSEAYQATFLSFMYYNDFDRYLPTSTAERPAGLTVRPVRVQK